MRKKRKYKTINGYIETLKSKQKDYAKDYLLYLQGFFCKPTWYHHRAGEKIRLEMLRLFKI